MKRSVYPTEVIYQRGGTAVPAVYTVNPHDPEDEEDTKQAVMRRNRNRKVSRQKKRRAFEKKAAALAAEPTIKA